jgi:hypothetical protein
MSNKLRLAPIAIVVAIAAAGCGSSNNSTANNSAAKAKLVAEADPICKHVAVKREAANASLHGTSKSTLEKLAQLAPKVSVTEHQAVEQLRALKTPASLSQEWQQMLSGIEQLANDTTKLAVVAKANDLKKVEALTASGRKVREKLTVIATRDGFAYCGRTS